MVKVLNARLSISFRHESVLARKTLSASEVTCKTVIVNFITCLCTVSKRSILLVPVESIVTDRTDVVEVEEHEVFVPFGSYKVVFGIDVTVCEFGLTDLASWGRPESSVAFSTGGVFIANGAVLQSC